MKGTPIPQERRCTRIRNDDDSNHRKYPQQCRSSSSSLKSSWTFRTATTTSLGRYCSWCGTCLLLLLLFYNINNHHRCHYYIHALSMSAVPPTGRNHRPPPATTTTTTTTTKVAIIGGGIAGLACAQELSRAIPDPTNKEGRLFDVTVFDTGRLRPGGRCSSRQPGDRPKDNNDDDKTNNSNSEFPLLSQFRYDHAAQLIVGPRLLPSSSSTSDQPPQPQSTLQQHSTQHHPAFTRQLQEWLDQGIIQEFPPNSICQISKGGKVQPLMTASSSSSSSSSLAATTTFYHATQGMGSLATSLVAANKDNRFQLKQDVWVSPSSGVRYQKNTGQWKLQAKGTTLGYFDELIIAHNGKCADRIMSQTPAKELHSLLRVQFSPTVSMKNPKMTLNSLYSLTVVVPKDSALSHALPEPFQCGFVQDHPHLKMISCQTRKYPPTTSDHLHNDGLSHQKYEVWNILSSATFGKTYKAPQEALPAETVHQVTMLLWKATMETLGLAVASSAVPPGGHPNEQEVDDDEDNKRLPLPILEARVQLWGAAVPLNVWPHDFLWDSSHRVGVCGDWLVEPSIAGAYTSGHLLAQHLVSSASPPSHGLMVEKGSFVRSEGSSQLGLAALTLNNNKTNRGNKKMPVQQ